jgi:hypothetical protein
MQQRNEMKQFKQTDYPSEAAMYFAKAEYFKEMATKSKARERDLLEALAFYAHPETYAGVNFEISKDWDAEPDFINDFHQTDNGMAPGKMAHDTIIANPNIRLWAAQQDVIGASIEWYQEDGAKEEMNYVIESLIEVMKDDE